MRMTVLDNGFGRKIDPRNERYRVFLDDVEVKFCFSADDEKGIVIMADETESGEMSVVNGDINRVTRYGKVVIEPKP